MRKKINIIIYILSKPIIKFIKYGYLAQRIISIFKKDSIFSKKIFVLGIPRSGTSFLTGALMKLGFDPGPQFWLKKLLNISDHCSYSMIR